MVFWVDFPKASVNKMLDNIQWSQAGGHLKVKRTNLQTDPIKNVKLLNLYYL